MLRSNVVAPMMAIWYLLNLPANVLASPAIKLAATVKSVEKGGAFEILAVVSTAEPISNVRIAALGPEGFLIEPVPSVGIGVGNSKDPVATIAGLPAGSAITVAFKVWAPSIMGYPRGRDSSGKLGPAAKESFYSTFGGRQFNFNLVYDAPVDGKNITDYQTETIEVGYTTAIGFYVVMGMVGVLIGYIVKQSTQGRKEIMEAANAASSVPGKLAAIAKYYFIQNLPSLLTLLAIGFAALITLAREGLPASSWNAALALGIGLSVLTDDEIFGKLKP